jgi:cell wall-associated NlpC family hydrolase
VVVAAALSSLAACVSTPRTPTPPISPQGLPSGGGDALPHEPGYGAPGYGAPGKTRALMIDTAVGMLGQPYKYGGAAPGGFDCSGLVVYAAAGAGLHLPRTANEQRQLGTSVSRSHLEAGDLVFMHVARKELHVGIALDGTRFIHAPSTGGRVRIDSIAAEPYAAGFIGARRVIADR